jgi:hypothetical protein
MSEQQPPLMQGMVLGGVLISAVGAASTTFTEGKKPSVKSVSRDFIVGAVMLMLVMQLLPESSATLVKFIMGLVPLALFQKGGADTAAAPAAADDIEVRVGVPRF